MFSSIFGAQKFDKAKMVKTALADTDHLHVGLLCLETGQAQDSHVHEGSDKLYFIVEGVAHVTIGKESHDLGPGAFAVVKGGEHHSLTNRGRDRVTALVVVAPPPPPKK